MIDDRDPRAKNPEGIGQPTEITFDEFLKSLPKEAQDRIIQELQKARFDGAMLVARTAAHEINNALSPVVGYAELLSIKPNVMADPMVATYIEAIGKGANDARAMILRYQQMVRLVEVPSALGPGKPLLNPEASIKKED